MPRCMRDSQFYFIFIEMTYFNMCQVIIEYDAVVVSMEVNFVNLSDGMTYLKNLLTPEIPKEKKKTLKDQFGNRSNSKDKII